jgi:hypothetical protein
MTVEGQLAPGTCGSERFGARVAIGPLPLYRAESGSSKPSPETPCLSLDARELSARRHAGSERLAGARRGHERVHPLEQLLEDSGRRPPDEVLADDVGVGLE